MKMIVVAEACEVVENLNPLVGIIVYKLDEDEHNEVVNLIEYEREREKGNFEAPHPSGFKVLKEDVELAKRFIRERCP